MIRSAPLTPLFNNNTNNRRLVRSPVFTPSRGVLCVGALAGSCLVWWLLATTQAGGRRVPAARENDARARCWRHGQSSFVRSPASQSRYRTLIVPSPNRRRAGHPELCGLSFDEEKELGVTRPDWLAAVWAQPASPRPRPDASPVVTRVPISITSATRPGQRGGTAKHNGAGKVRFCCEMRGR